MNIDKNHIRKKIEEIVPDIKVFKTAKKERKESKYKQYDLYMPLVLRLVTLIAIPVSIVMYLWVDVELEILIITTIVWGSFIIYSWFIIPIMRLIVLSNPNKKEYSAIVTDIVESTISKTNKMPNQVLLLKIVETEEPLFYETNKLQSEYNIGQKIQIYVADNKWIIKRKYD